MQTLQRGPAAASLAFLLLLAGCGESEKIYQVSGTVTYDGKPVPKGLIFFDPDPSKGTGGAQGAANILDGKYNTAEGAGVQGGAYYVRVNGFDGNASNDAPFGQPLFPEYNGSTELPKQDSTYDLEIPKSR